MWVANRLKSFICFTYNTQLSSKVKPRLLNARVEGSAATHFCFNWKPIVEREDVHEIYVPNTQTDCLLIAMDAKEFEYCDHFNYIDYFRQDNINCNIFLLAQDAQIETFFQSFDIVRNINRYQQIRLSSLVTFSLKLLTKHLEMFYNQQNFH